MCLFCLNDIKLFQGQCKSAVVLSEAGSSVVQLDHGNKSLLVSTKQRSVIYKMDESTVQVGQKDRKMYEKHFSPKLLFLSENYVKAFFIMLYMKMSRA